tara:strand:- start:14129 stop:14380 length:252 start_codon:yes stop_codon:yes gene_type:complete
MLNIGIIEFLIIFFFLIVLIKPKEIPKIYSNFGLIFRKLNQFLSNIKYDLSDIDLNEELRLDKNKKKKKIKNGISRSSKRIKK